MNYSNNIVSRFILFLFLLVVTNTKSQVLLDIDGAIKIGNSEPLTPEVGTIRWNQSTMDFEGYTLEGWKSLTNNSSAKTLYGSENSPLEELEIFETPDSTYDRQMGISIDMDENAIIVGSQGGSLSEMGVAYIYELSNGNWEVAARLTASDSSAGDKFSWDVAIDGNFAIIGAHGNDDNGSNSGSAYIFHRTSSGVWEEQTKLTASDGSAGDSFGWSVDIQDSTVIVTANMKDTLTGSAYIFNKSGTSWIQTQILSPNIPLQLMRFGWGCAISDSIVVVGALTSQASKGSAFVFRNDGLNWNQEVELFDVNGATNDRFGKSMVITGNNVIIGSYKNDEAGENAGAILNFHYDGSNWQLQQKILPSNELGNTEYFGWSMAQHGDYLIVGADLEDVNEINSGTAHLYQNLGSSWSYVRTFGPSNEMMDANFGWSTAIYGTTIMIGSPNHIVDGNPVGLIYMY